ncbi:hypothetical protein K3495_g2357 [Podosphaera aphanis]|nr:hypothetical protein K3495_g2357 [Podosphaera aphanis]
MSLPKPSDSKSDTEDINNKLDIQHIDIVIGGITFATMDEVKASIKESSRKTEVYTLSERLSKIEAITPIPILKSSNWYHWHESVQKLIQLSDTSAAFLPDPPRNKALTMWSIWWASKLRETAPEVQTAPRDPPRFILSKIANVTNGNAHTNKINIVHRFWIF